MNSLEKVGKYPVSRILGNGATSVVYLGRDEFGKRDVAIKVIYPEVLRDEHRGKIYRNLLLSEAGLIGKLVHPHIVQIFDASLNEDDLSYVVMEYVPGGTLYQHCSKESLLPIHRTIEVIFKCCRALDYANRMGIIHRDVKPANILIAQDSDIRISDFGTAIGLEPDRTQVAGVGSPAYMSPQQVREHPLNHQTDIYSLGATMYQMLTGRLPFEADTNYNMIYQIIHNEVTPPSRLRTDIPQTMDRLVLKSMAKSLEDRYQTWEEVAHDLANVFNAPAIQVFEGQGNITTEAQKFELLRDIGFFQQFDEVELWEVVRFSVWEYKAVGDFVMHEGDIGDFFSFILEGEVQISRKGVTLNILGPGDCLGEIGVIAGTPKPRNANAVALRDTKLITIHKDAFYNSSSPCRMHFYQAFLNVMVRRLEVSNARLSGV